MASISAGASSSFLSERSENILGDYENVLKSVFLKPLDEVLRCRICFEYFNSCMMTKCSHNYCSLCIRRYMSYKSQCPTCFQAATEPELRNNRLVDEIIRIYKKISETLEVSLSKDCQSFETEKVKSSGQVLNEGLDQERKKMSKALEQSKNVDVGRYNDFEISEVSCPVCYSSVLSGKINDHLNSCLKQMEKKTFNSERKSLPKLVYHLLSDEEIKKKLEEHNLPVTGNRQALIRRHKNYINLYNANCDSLNPRPVSELLKEIKHQENEEMPTVAQRKIQINKRSDPLSIEKEQQSYAQHHQLQFNALIDDIIQRQKDKYKINQELEKIHTHNSNSEKFDETHDNIWCNLKDSSKNVDKQKPVVENPSAKDDEKEVSPDSSNNTPK